MQYVDKILLGLYGLDNGSISYIKICGLPSLVASWLYKKLVPIRLLDAVQYADKIVLLREALLQSGFENRTAVYRYINIRYQLIRRTTQNFKGLNCLKILVSYLCFSILMGTTIFIIDIQFENAIYTE